MGNYLEDLKRFNVSVVVRVCEATYSPEKLKSEGINVVDLSFPDGSPPPQQVIDSWFELLRGQFTGRPETCVAVHCVAGEGGFLTGVFLGVFRFFPLFDAFTR
jgi:protein tyrosine phosphatase type 4A